MDATIETMCHKTWDLRRQLRKAMVDHVSDSSIEGSTALMMLVEAALNGDEKAVDESAGVFNEHAAKLVEVARPTWPAPCPPTQRDQQHCLGAGQQTQKQGRSNIIIINSQFESATAPIFIIQTRQVQLSYNICQLIIKKGNCLLYTSPSPRDS